LSLKKKGDRNTHVKGFKNNMHLIIF